MNFNMRFSAAGNPEDYDADEREALLQATARAVGFSSAPGGSSITITAASVSIAASFPVASSTEAEDRARSASALSTPDALSAAINSQLTAMGATMSIESTGGSSFAATSTASTTTSALTTSSGGGLGSTVVIGAAAGGAAVLAALVFAGCWCAKSKGSSKPYMKQIIDVPAATGRDGVELDRKSRALELERASRNQCSSQI